MPCGEITVGALNLETKLPVAFSHLIIIDFIVKQWESGTWIALMLCIS